MTNQTTTQINTTALQRLGDARAQLSSELAKVIVGQEEVINQLLICIFSRGHCLLEGVPGLAKTLMISTLARTMDLSFVVSSLRRT